jgi:naphthoate synthase
VARVVEKEKAQMAYETILYEEDGPIGWLTLNRPDDGNMFTPQMCHEIRDCINEVRRETRTRVLVITGAGDKFFCIGGRKEGMEDTLLYAGVLPTLEMYESIDRLQKPVIASVNGFAVGGGNVLQVVCDLTIAKESAVFRQVGPMMGSFDAGFGTWYLEDLIGKKKAKEMWMLNPRLSAKEALEIGLINRVVPDGKLREETRGMALELAERGAFALASIKGAFSARHGGVGGLARMAHDLLLRGYLETEESHELGEAFRGKRKPNPDKFGH